MKKNILVIDDDTLAQKMIVAAMEEDGHRAEALSLIHI